MKVECTCPHNSIRTSFRSLNVVFKCLSHDSRFAMSELYAFEVIAFIKIPSFNRAFLHFLRSSTSRAFRVFFRFLFGSIRSCATAERLLFQSIAEHLLQVTSCGCDQTNPSRRFMVLYILKWHNSPEFRKFKAAGHQHCVT